MPIINPFPLQIVAKQNSPELQAYLAQFGHALYADANDFSIMITALNYLYENQSPGAALELGENANNAYYGDKGKEAYDHSQSTGNPHGTTPADIGAYSIEESDSLLLEKENSWMNSGPTILIPQRGQANYSYIGIAPAGTVHSGITGRNIASTNYFTMQNRVGYVTTAVAGNVAFCRQQSDGICLNFPFNSAFIFGKSLKVSGQRSFIGYTADGTFTPSNIEPNTILNCLGICELSTSGNWQIIHNDGTGIANTIDLGIDFPSNTSSTDVYAAYFSKIDGGANIIVYRISTSGVVTHSVSYDIIENLPSSSSVLFWRWFTTNNTTAAICSIDIFRIKNGY